MNHTINFGQQGEQLIVEKLIKENFIILEKNYKKFFGEIDIIAQKNNLIIFVEVKARKNPLFSMFELISKSKQNKIIKVAQTYLQINNISQIHVRFDVALINNKSSSEIKIDYIESAFTQENY